MLTAQVPALRSAPEGEAAALQLLMRLPAAILIQSGERISFANEAALRLFGTGEAALLDRPLEALIHGGATRRVARLVELLRSGAQPAPLGGLHILRADGGVRSVELAGTPLNAIDGRSVVLVLRDLTGLPQALDALDALDAPDAPDGPDDQRRAALIAREEVQREERQRIARELHDDLQQALAGIRLQWAAVGRRIEPAPADLKSMIDDGMSQVAQSIESVRRIVVDLRPEALEVEGLLPALESLVAKFRRRTGAACRLEVQDDAGAELLPAAPGVATCLYRVAQESLENVARHAQATETELRFSRAADGTVSLRIRDNGRGMQIGSSHDPQSFGLLGMRERTRSLGAVLRIESWPGLGTTIEVIAPNTVVPPAEPSATPIR